MNEIPLTNIALKTSRLARLLNDCDMEKTLQFEASGYPVEQGVQSRNLAPGSRSCRKIYREGWI